MCCQLLLTVRHTGYDSSVVSLQMYFFLRKRNPVLTPTYKQKTAQLNWNYCSLQYKVHNTVYSIAKAFTPNQRTFTANIKHWHALPFYLAKLIDHKHLAVL